MAKFYLVEDIILEFGCSRQKRKKKEKRESIKQRNENYSFSDGAC